MKHFEIIKNTINAFNVKNLLVWLDSDHAQYVKQRRYVRSVVSDKWNVAHIYTFI